MQTIVSVVFAVFLLALFAGCASRGKALRPSVNGDTPKRPCPSKADAYYVESVAKPGEKQFSCSFVEFDERGDYLRFSQHQHAYKTIQELGRNGERLLVVVYVHGWKNNSQSGDVIKFNKFLQELARAPFVQEGGFRVHGVFLSWRGNSFRHAIDTESTAFKDTLEAFREPIVNPDYTRGTLAGAFLWMPEQLSYWSRKGAAEHKVSGISIIRTILLCGHTARRYSDPKAPNRVFLVGHSFGALMLEQSFAPASLGRLTAEWPWDDEELIKQSKANPLPFDLVLLVNSAAPSVYAKQFYSYMAGHRQALARNDAPGADAPLVISLTSSADQATGRAHKWANLFAPWYPSLRREYDGTDFILDLPASERRKVKVPQHYYYRRTPGHNPLLVTHWIIPAAEQPQSREDISRFQQNLDLARETDVATRTFRTSPRKAGGTPLAWHITTTSPHPSWSTYKGHRPVFLGKEPVRSSYWIMRCPKQIISGHNDIWSQQAMETYAALFREAEYLRTQAPEKEPQLDFGLSAGGLIGDSEIDQRPANGSHQPP